MVLFGAAFAAGKASGGGDSGEESSGDSASKPKAAEKVTAPEAGSADVTSLTATGAVPSLKPKPEPESSTTTSTTATSGTTSTTRGTSTSTTSTSGTTSGTSDHGYDQRHQRYDHHHIRRLDLRWHDYDNHRRLTPLRDTSKTGALTWLVRSSG